MFSPETIRSMSDNAAAKARKASKVPVEYDPIDEPLRFCRSIPNLGSYTPKGYRLVRDYMVDSSGFGSPGEPALTISRFCDLVKEPQQKKVLYGIIEAGQFQIVMGEFEKEA